MARYIYRIVHMRDIKCWSDGGISQWDDRQRAQDFFFAVTGRALETDPEYELVEFTMPQWWIDQQELLDALHLVATSVEAYGMCPTEFEDAYKEAERLLEKHAY